MSRSVGSSLFGCMVVVSLSLSAAAALGGAAPFYQNTFEKQPSVAAMTRIGRELFFDRALSASGKTSCASCHDPAHAFGPPNGSAIQLAGPNGVSPGVRAVPSLTYTQNVPVFTEHFFEADGNDSEDQGPVGGWTWDGRARSPHDQALIPLFSPFEMANTDKADLVERIRRSRYAGEFRDVFGAKTFDDAELAFKAVLMALEVYQQSPAEFYPYSSKYDAWLRGEAELSARERRGLGLFNDPSKGNCARCHPSRLRNGVFPQFTDYGYVALGVPRNRRIPANADPQYYDLGLCGPYRIDLEDNRSYCGMFRTPSLRNVARRSVFFHNGAVRALRDAVRFYAERDTHPEKWYPHTSGGIDKFDDLPVQYRSNVENQHPFGRHPGDPSPLDDSEIDDIVAFLNTLSDGYSP